MSSRKVFITGLDIASDDDLEGVGTIRQVGAKWYKWVKFNEGSGPVAIAAGDVVVYHGDDGYDDQEVTGDFSDGDGVAAGVAESAPTNGQFFWIQTKGARTLNTTLTAGADGNALTAVGAGDKTLDVSAAVTDAIAGVAVDASADKVLLDCPW